MGGKGGDVALDVAWKCELGNALINIFTDSYACTD